MRMKRSLAVLALLMAIAAPALAQQTNALTNVFYIAPGGNCTAVACTSASKRMCRNSGTSSTLYTCNTSTGFYDLASGGGGGGTPGGSDTQVQFNNAAVFGGDAGFVYNASTDRATVLGGAVLGDQAGLAGGSYTASAHIACSPTSGDYCLDMRLGRDAWWQKATTFEGVVATLAEWDPSQDRWEKTTTGTEAAQMVERTTSGTLTWRGTTGAFRTAGTALTFNDAMTLDTSASTGGKLTVTGGVVEPNKKVVEICAVGCEYTTLSAACAAETSTAAAPVAYHVQAGVYAAADTMCSGEDHATFYGDGAGNTTLTGIDHGFGEANGNDCVADVHACKGALNLGTSKNVEVYGFTLTGASRGLWWNGAGTGGGQSYIHDNELIATATGGDEDCFYWVNFAAGGEIRIMNNLCTTDADGFTINNDGTTRIFSTGNVFHTTATIKAQTALWAFYSIPCYFYSKNDSFWVSGGLAGANNIYAYQFNGSPSDLTGAPTAAGCAGTAQVIIQSPSIKIANTTAAGNSGLTYGVRLQSTALGEMGSGRVDIIGADCEVSTADTTFGAVYCVSNEISGFTNVNVLGGRLRASGGPAGTTRDISANGAGGNYVNVLSVDYTSDTSSTVAAPLDMRHIKATGGAQFGPGPFTFTNTTGNYPTVQQVDPGPGLELDNTDEVNSEASPALLISNSTAAGGDDTFFFQVDSSGNLNFDYPSIGTNKFRIRPGPDLAEFDMARLSAFAPGAYLELGDASSNADVGLWARTGSNAAHLSWNQGTLAWVADNADKIRLAGTAANPTMANAGEIAIDTTANQLLAYSGGAVRVFDPVRSACAIITDLAAADDNFEFWMPPQAVTVTAVGCRCRGTCSTLATFTLEDRGGNAMTITGTNPTCATTGNSTYAAVTAGNTLAEGEGIAFDVTNAVNPETDEYTICVKYTVDRQ